VERLGWVATMVKTMKNPIHYPQNKKVRSTEILVENAVPNPILKVRSTEILVENDECYGATHLRNGFNHRFSTNISVLRTFFYAVGNE
jgi:hypothetical protein